ncbi:DUF2252 domain-containing protein [Protaetiibacter larvae]|uniref:DUF2252 domain-containing protein n=1 Tax=Protaetiibacter larvae TaxID=2592654 RepID=A0A5C1Y9Q2_9MICO|nr:DUF2252 domain-containing protein [Protaetiibacter larvae]QEO09889.1 DUF2252 domain-containing protein [Protaetiibacter larvae]
MDLTHIDGVDVRSAAELRAAGRARRGELPRSAHAAFRPSPRRDPLGIIDAQNVDRLPELLPLRAERMRQSPFAFYRGTAAVQAADLRDEPVSGAAVVIAGDAHLSNFGFYQSPQRTLVFDMNDFDEVAVAPWEWDVKRFVTSVVVAARARNAAPAIVEEDALIATRFYRRAMRAFDALPPIERFYRRIDLDAGGRVPPSLVGVVDEARRAAKRRTSQHVVARTTVLDADGRRVFVDNPPVLTHVGDDVRAVVERLFGEYLLTTRADIALLLSHYRIDDIARRVVGVGSVGTRCYILAFSGPDGEPLVMQVKEAGDSVAYSHGGMPGAELPGVREGRAIAEAGYRVVSGQRILQAVSDPFLGYLENDGRAFYVRQFRDGNSSVEIEALDEDAFRWYAKACAWVLARGHAQSPALPFIAGYLGTGDAFDRAMAQWALAYADRAEADHAAFVAATG